MPDQYQRPKKSDGQRGDSSGIAITGLSVNRDYSTVLKGTRRIKEYDMMRLGESSVRAVLLAINLPILSARWRIDAASDSRADRKVAEFVEDNILKNPDKMWQETLNEILLYLPYGSMPFEEVWEYDGTYIKLKKLASIFPDTIYRWATKDSNTVIQTTQNGKFEIPMEKMVIFINQKEGDNWEGQSILRTAYKDFDIKAKFEMIDALSAERQGLGVPYAKRTGMADPTEDDKMEELLQNLRANEKGYIVFNSKYEVGFLDMKAGTLKQLLPSIQYRDRQIAKSVLAQFLELGSSNVGSFALSADQSKLFVQSLESVAKYICDCYNRYIIKKLVDYNFVVEKYPVLAYDKIGTVDVNAFTTALQRAMQIGVVTPDATLEEYVRDIMDLPDFDGSMSVDLTMADQMIADLEGQMAEVDGSATPDAPAQQEDPENPGFDMEGMPMQDPAAAQASWSDEDWKTAADEIGFKFKGGAVGQPLSEETKRKISEALKKLGKKGTKGKGKKTTNPAITQKQAEIKKLNAEVKGFRDSARRELLEMKSKGIKLSPEEAAKKQLELFDKQKPISDKISKLRDEIAEIKSKAAPSATPATPEPKKKADEIADTLERINGMIDKYESTK